MTLLTVFTPTYNRADLLKRCFQHMKQQTNSNFIWMIIDDGSTDGTEDLVAQWQQEDLKFKIEYYYKENGGLHTTYNEAISHITTDLCVCIDSDDYMPDNAVETILDFWNKNGSNEYAGIVGLDYYTNETVIGDPLPQQKSVNLIDLLIGTYKINNGDRTNVVRTELYKKYAPMKTFKGEKNFNPHYLHLLISQEYDFLVLNENLRYVEYQPGGMSANILRQYANSPNSFAEIRKLYLSFPNTSLLFRIKHSIHLVSSFILAKKFKRLFKENKFGIILLASIPFGFLLSLYIKFKVRK